MASLNKVQLIGRLGRDIELAYSRGGNAIANLNLATDESYMDRDGNKVERTEWHRVVVYGKIAENCNTFLAKGSLVYIEGSLQTRKWQDQQGNDRYTTEIKAQRVQFLDRKNDKIHNEQRQDNQQNHYQRQTNNRYNNDSAFPSESDVDEMPF